MFKTNILVFIICVLFISCSEEDLIGPNSEYQVLIKVEDMNGVPFKPDRVFWYYPPSEQTNTIEFEAESINRDSTQFKVESAEIGLIYIVAEYRRDHPDPYCFYSAYDAGAVEIKANMMKEITRHMDIKEICQ